MEEIKIIEHETEVVTTYGTFKQSAIGAETAQRKKAEAGIKEEIAAVGTALAEKMLEREMTAADHEKMIASFLDEMGDAE